MSTNIEWCDPSIPVPKADGWLRWTDDLGIAAGGLGICINAVLTFWNALHG